MQPHAMETKHQKVSDNQNNTKESKQANQPTKQTNQPKEQRSGCPCKTD